MSKRALGNDPLCSSTKKGPAKAPAEAPQKKAEATGKKTSATFRIRDDLLQKLKDYCYTERISQGEGIERALDLLFRKVKEEDLLKRPEK